ncbi:MAG TPA: hypothetical protein VNA04_07590 [Thermoanaerobaculia bacterium]|nr:hypothetical protein [Thermoanaerobaculia bacterium]
MRQIAPSFALGLLLAAAPAVAAETTTTEPSLYIVHFSTGPAWKADTPFPRQQHAQEHSRNLRRLRDEETLLLGARYADKGMIILRSPSEAQARAEIESDPAVQAGVFTYELARLSPFFEGCVTRSPTKPAGPPSTSCRPVSPSAERPAPC